jgi:phosphate transport system substrate-binding protein
MKELVDRWITAFAATHPDIALQLTAKGALTAAPALAQGSAEIATLGREFTPPELAAFRAGHAYDPLGFRVALGSYDISGKTVALAFFVNRDNPISQLSFTQLDAVYCGALRRGEREEVTTWGQLGLQGEWAARRIVPIGVNFPDGISNFIRLRVCQDGTFRSDVKTEHTGGPINVLQRIVIDVAADPGAIGYSGFANAAPGVKQIKISEDGVAYRAGTRQEVADASYPLTRFIYFFIDRKPGEAIPRAVLEFLRYVMSPEGQALVATDGVYMPLPGSIAAEERNKLK